MDMPGLRVIVLVACTTIFGSENCIMTEGQIRGLHEIEDDLDLQA